MHVYENLFVNFHVRNRGGSKARADLAPGRQVGPRQRSSGHVAHKGNKNNSRLVVNPEVLCKQTSLGRLDGRSRLRQVLEIFSDFLVMEEIRS